MFLPHDFMEKYSTTLKEFCLAVSLEDVLKMFYSKYIIISTLIFQFLQLISAGNSKSPICKAALGSSDWPSLSQWTALNASVSGRLLKPPPPGAVCHPDQPTYSAAECPIVLTGWYTIPFHVENPISSAWDTHRLSINFPFRWFRFSLRT
jgi:hypothetical protein